LEPEVEMGLRKNFSRKYQRGNRSLEAGGPAISSIIGNLRFSMLFGGGQRNIPQRILSPQADGKRGNC